METVPSIIDALGRLDITHIIVIAIAVAVTAAIFKREIIMFRLRKMAGRPSFRNGARTHVIAANAKSAADAAGKRLASHEQHCEERHADTNNKFSSLFRRMSRVEKDTSFIRGAIEARWGIRGPVDGD